MSDMNKLSIDELTIAGVPATGSATAGVQILIKDTAGNAVFAVGPTLPADGGAGFAVGCIFIDNDSTTTAASLYTNVGSTTSCNFDPR